MGRYLVSLSNGLSSSQALITVLARRFRVGYHLDGETIPVSKASRGGDPIRSLFIRSPKYSLPSFCLQNPAFETWATRSTEVWPAARGGGGGGDGVVPEGVAVRRRGCGGGRNGDAGGVPGEARLRASAPGTPPALCHHPRPPSSGL